MADTSSTTGPQGDKMEVIPYERCFEDDLVEICWETGLMGQSLAGTGRFEDKRLFAMIFALPYARFEPAICRVAVAGTGKGRRAVGYIIGTTDTRAEEAYFAMRCQPAIAARLALVDWWLHPESARQVMRFLSGRRAATSEAPAGAGTGDPSFEAGGPGYPAQLHINLHPAWQGHGLGSALMASYLAALRERKVPGLFLETSSRNDKALPFYEKLGFRLVAESEPRPGEEFWPGLPARGLTYAMEL